MTPKTSAAAFRGLLARRKRAASRRGEDSLESLPQGLGTSSIDTYGMDHNLSTIVDMPFLTDMKWRTGKSEVRAMRRRSTPVVLAILVSGGALALAASAAGVDAPVPEPEGWAASKQAIVDREDELIAEGNANPAQVDSSWTASEPSPPVYDPDGLYGEAEISFPISSGYVFNSLWLKSEEDRHLSVYVGSEVEIPTTGVILIMERNQSGEVSASSQHQAPIPGPLRVESVTGYRLAIVSDSDASSTVFNVATKTFE